MESYPQLFIQKWLKYFSVQSLSLVRRGVGAVCQSSVVRHQTLTRHRQEFAEHQLPSSIATYSPQEGWWQSSSITNPDPIQSCQILTFCNSFEDSNSLSIHLDSSTWGFFIALHLSTYLVHFKNRYRFYINHNFQTWDGEYERNGAKIFSVIMKWVLWTLPWTKVAQRLTLFLMKTQPLHPRMWRRGGGLKNWPILLRQSRWSVQEIYWLVYNPGTKCCIHLRNLQEDGNNRLRIVLTLEKIKVASLCSSIYFCFIQSGPM